MGVVVKIDTVIASETSRLRTDECHEAMLTSITIRRREGALSLLDGDRRQKRKDAQIDRFAHVHRGRPTEPDNRTSRCALKLILDSV